TIRRGRGGGIVSRVSCDSSNQWLSPRPVAVGLATRCSVEIQRSLVPLRVPSVWLSAKFEISITGIAGMVAAFSSRLHSRLEIEQAGSVAAAHGGAVGIGEPGRRVEARDRIVDAHVEREIG